MDYIRGLIGIVCIVGVGYLISTSRKSIDWKLVAVGVLMQIVIAFLVLKVSFVNHAFQVFGQGLVTFLSFSLNGAEFLFGDLVKDSSKVPGTKHSLGFLFAFQALPTVVFLAR